MAVLKWLLISVASIYAIVIAVLYLAQRSMLYPIPQTIRTTPAAAGYPEAEEHALATADGETVIAWHVPPRNGKPVVIFFHGNGEVLAWRVPRFRAITADGTGLVALSFRGYAGSSGSPTEAGLVNDADAAYAFAASRYPPQRIAVWGFSLGTGPATALAVKQKIGKLILEAPYTSTVDVASRVFPFLPVQWLMRDRYHSDRRIGSVTAPLLIMHGARDQVIGIAFGERLYSLARDPKRMIRFPNGIHEDLDDHGAVEAVRKFLAETFQDNPNG